MKEKTKNQRSAGKIIPPHSKFTELTNDVSKDTGVLYGQKGGTPCRIGVMWYTSASVI